MKINKTIKLRLGIQEVITGEFKNERCITAMK